MNPQEKVYYKQLQISRAQKQKEKIVGKAAGKVAGAAVSATGVGAPLAFLAKKAGEVAGKKAYRNKKWIIALIIAAIVLPPLIIFALTFFVIIVSTYAIVCYNPISYVASWIPGLSGLLPC